jgi:hypothetical protein
VPPLRNDDPERERQRTGELVTKIDAENLGKADWKLGEVPGPAFPPSPFSKEFRFRSE